MAAHQATPPQSGGQATAPSPGSSLGDIWRLTWPQTLMMVFHFTIGFVDVFAAGQLGRDIQASFGLIAQSMMFFLIVAIATANGATAAISQSLGAGRGPRAERYTRLVCWLALAAGGILCLAFLPLAETFLAALQTPDGIRPMARDFLQVYLLSMPAYYLLVVTNAVFRAHKAVRVPMATMAAITVVNALGDLWVGLGWWGGPGVGHIGVAWATFASVSLGATINLLLLWRLGTARSLPPPPLRWVRRAVVYLVKVAMPAAGMQTLWQTGYLVLYAVVASLPEHNVAAMAGLAAGMRIESALFLPGFAFNLTASILVGHHLGAGDFAGAKRTALVVLALGVGLMSCLAVVVWFNGPALAALLSDDPAVRLEIVNYLVYNLLAIPFTLSGMILGGAMVGAGATLYNLAVFGVSAWCVRLPMAAVLGIHVMAEPTGVWLSMLVSQMFQGAALLYLFLTRDWGRYAMRSRKRQPSGAPTAAAGPGANHVPTVSPDLRSPKP